MPKLPPKYTKKAEAANAKPVRDVLYSQIETRLFCRDPSRVSQPDALTADLAKELLGWTEVADSETEYLLVDAYGKKIVCSANLENRHFDKALCNLWMLEILRGKWCFNGETIVLDENGQIQQGQHRLVALVLAVQTWQKDQQQTKPKQIWQLTWPTEPCIDCLIVLGISSADEVINTMDTGKPRTLTDALYRSIYFRDLEAKKRQKFAKLLDWAIRFLWRRTAQSLSAAERYGQVGIFDRKRPHSESLEFLNNHPKLMECLELIGNEEESRIKPYVPVSYAVGLLYLMGSGNSDGDKYTSLPQEDSLDWSMWDKASAFWIDLAARGELTEPLRELLDSDEYLPPEAIGNYRYDLQVGTVVKAWQCFSQSSKAKKRIPVTSLMVDRTVNSLGQAVLSECPRCGGIDVG